MTEIDITVAVTAHSETVIAGPTMRSAELAIRAAEAEGFQVERLIGFDAPSEHCRAFFTQPAFASWTTAEFDMRDQGRTRNALVEIATGRWVAFLDADDLFSENWLALGAQRLAQAQKTQDRIVVHPEMNWVFDGGAFVFTKPAQDDRIFTPYYFYCTNYYDTLCMAPREVFLAKPYAIRDIPNGFAYEDWQWNIETMAAGWRHVIAKDTIVFKRRRDASQTLQSREHSACIRDIEPMAIDRITNLGRMPQDWCQDIPDPTRNADNLDAGGKMDELKKKWQDALPTEVEFWRGLFEQNSYDPKYVEAFLSRIKNEPNFLFESELDEPAGTMIKVLDVGAGPLTHVGRISPRYKVSVIAIDPLARQYEDLWAKSGQSPRVPTVYGKAERLEEMFGPQEFDFVYCRNSLDHTYDLLTAVKQMVRVCKRLVLIVGHRNEGEKAKYTGLHSWNCEPTPQGDLLIWNRESSASLREELRGIAEVFATGEEWFQCRIKPIHC